LPLVVAFESRWVGALARRLDLNETNERAANMYRVIRTNSLIREVMLAG
jgi:hypothetical protein